MNPSSIRVGMRVSVPREKVAQRKPWEEPYGTIIKINPTHGVLVRLDGECGTAIRVQPDELDDE